MRLSLLVLLIFALSGSAQTVKQEQEIAEKRARAFSVLKKLNATLAYSTVIVEGKPKELLTRIELKGPNVTDEAMEHLRIFPALQTLYICNTRVTDEGLARLEPLRNLQVLYLTYNLITDEGVSHLKNFVKLDTIGLSYTSVGDRGAQALSTLRNLQTIALSHTNVSDAGVRQLQKLANLRHLYLDGTLISAAGVDLFKGVPLETLSYRGTRAAATLGNDGFLKKPAPPAPAPAPMMP